MSCDKVCDRARAAFTVIEILIVVVVLGVMAALALPRIMRRQPDVEWTHIQHELNTMVLFARQEAISHRKPYRLVFISSPRGSDTVVIERQDDANDQTFTRTYSEYFSTEYELPQTVSLKALFWGKDEQFEPNKGKGYCYIIPDGLVQDVLLHMERRDKEKVVSASFKMKPFLGEFELYEDQLIRPA